MGNLGSKKAQKEPDGIFSRERLKEMKRKKKKKNQLVRRAATTKDAPVTPTLLAMPPGPSPVPTPAHVVSYDEAALKRMRWQLHNDSDAFLLNNILLSVQFFENYEREIHQIKNNPISEREHLINEAMVRENKHVFFADRLQECVHEHVSYQRSRGQTEPLSAPRLFVIYDNVEASEPGDTSDYSAVLDAPFYKLRIEDCREAGYIKLKKIEVLESTLQKENEVIHTNETDLDDSVYTDSEKESNDSDDGPYYAGKGKILLQQIKDKLEKPALSKSPDIDINNVEANGGSGRRFSGPIRQVSSQVVKSDISNLSKLKKDNVFFAEEDDIVDKNNYLLSNYDDFTKVPRKSCMKNNSRRMSGPVTTNFLNANLRNASSETNLGDDTETSGYRSNSSRQTDGSETESDYGYSTIIKATTPKKIELSMKTSNSVSSGVLPDEIWTPVEVRVLNDWSDDEEESVDDSASKLSLPRNLFERYFYLNSLRFMNNFVNHFIINLGSGLGLTKDEISTALTQGASIYCGSKLGYEIFPALVATWPNAANQWIIRERRIIQNPRTNFTYQWPTKYMVSKAISAGCLLVPVGFREKRGLNPQETLQWKLIYPAAERYLESCLAHSHMRCYLFTLALHKSFLENETAKIGVDASHIKNHLYWQCEENYARWPEDRLGESLRLFLSNFYVHFAKSRLPNYFMENCNEFESIPKPLLRMQQRQLADILEAPVMHVLNALDKIKYKKKPFYPKLNCQMLYDILTCKNPLRIINPNIPTAVSNYQDSSDSDEENQSNNLWDKAKAQDKDYQWKKRQHQMNERRKAQMNAKKQKPSGKEEREINRNIMLPVKMEPVRRRLVLEFFIPHFIGMARSSESFDAIRQAIIYLEQTQRLCTLLSEEPGADTTVNEYMKVVRDLLADCQRKLAHQGSFKFPPRTDSHLDRIAHRAAHKYRQKFEHIADSPTENLGIQAFSFVDVHNENNKEPIRLNDAMPGEESKL